LLGGPADGDADGHAAGGPEDESQASVGEREASRADGGYRDAVADERRRSLSNPSPSTALTTRRGAPRRAA
jgi:hypothetical protein